MNTQANNADTAVATALTPSEAVSRINALAKSIRGWVIEGEVRDASVSSGGHLYFSLADADKSVACVAWKGMLAGLAVKPQDGIRVRVTVRDARYWGKALQLVAGQVDPVGEGELLQRAQRLLEQLTREGLTSPARKRPLPFMPHTIGLITGHQARALDDITQSIFARFPARILYHQAAVQGVAAPDELIEAVGALSLHNDVAVIVIARGGGSVEDRDAFNNERLCRAIGASPVPVITSIGHSTDIHVCDHVADHSCPVPREVGAIVVPDANELRATIDGFDAQLAAAATQVRSARTELDRNAQRLATERIVELHYQRVGNLDMALGSHATRFLESGRTALDGAYREFQIARDQLPSMTDVTDLATRLAALAGRTLADHHDKAAKLDQHQAHLRTAATNARQRAREQLAGAELLLDARDPAKRGFAIVRLADGTLATTIDDLTLDTDIEIEFADGTATSHITHFNAEGTPDR